MNPDRWQKVKEIFHAAVNREAGERSAFLSEACAGDTTLRREVDSLIVAYEKDRTFIGSLTGVATAEMLTTNSELRAGQTLNHYQVLSTLGRGGMGEVYLARDLKLDRTVAIKILPAALAANRGRMRRFVQEAKTAAALNHPNIAHIYEIGESDGMHFIAMEFIDGVTLSAKIYVERVPLASLLKYLTQVAEGLAKAHAVGTVHRDLKPDNIMITRDDYAKILDFGLAKLVEPQRTNGLSHDSSEVATAIMPPPSIPGMIMGTVGYMSPEQAQGRINEIDHRSDIFSFGCLLFEAATGGRAFDGRDALDSLHKIVYEPTPQLRELLPLAPQHLQDITNRCLAKEPERRYQSITEVATELNDLQRELTSSGVEHSRAACSAPGEAPTIVTPEWAKNEFTITTTRRLNPIGLAVIGIGIVAVLAAIAFIAYRARSSSAAIESIAVMPFVNDSGNADVEYLSDGMTETLISSLSNLPNLNIKPRSEVFRYKGTEANPQQIGKELKVQAVLNGRVVQRGQEVSLYIELIDVDLDKVVWSQQYNRKQTDLITLQTDIARDVLSGLKIKLSSANEAKVTKTYTTNPEAYQSYLKGKYYANKFTKEGFRQSIDNFNQAIALDRNYSSAYSGLAYAYILLDDWFESPRQSAPKARDMAQKALAIDETDVDAHVVLGMVAHWYDWDWAAAEREFKRSLELNPKNSDAYTFYAFFLASMKRNDEARAVALQGLELDPLSSGMNFTLGSTLVFNHRWDEAIAHFQKAIELDPNYWFHHSYLGRSYEQKGMMPQAIVEFKKALELDDSQSENWAGLGHAYAVSGNKAEAEKMIAEMIKRSSQNIYVAPYNVAVIYAGLGDKDKAFEWLERAYADRAYYLPVYLITDARMDSLHNDPRFTDLVKRMNLPQ